MLDEVFSGDSAHRIKHDIYSSATGEFGGRNKVCIACDQNDLINLVTEREGSDIETELHIDALLLDVDFEILVSQRGRFPGTQSLHSLVAQSPVGAFNKASWTAKRKAASGVLDKS